MKLLRKYIKQLLKEEYNIEKNKWTLLGPDDLRRDDVMQQLYDMTCETYGPIGGHPKISCPLALNKYMYWIVADIDDDPEIDVGMYGKPTAAGHKMGGAANDGTPQAAQAYKEKSAELRSGGSIDGVGNWYGEVSGKPAYAMLSRGAPAIVNEQQVKALLKGKGVIWHGMHPDPAAPAVFKNSPGWYSRNLGGVLHTKIIVGSPKV